MIGLGSTKEFYGGGDIALAVAGSLIPETVGLNVTAS